MTKRTENFLRGIHSPLSVNSVETVCAKAHNGLVERRQVFGESMDSSLFGMFEAYLLRLRSGDERAVREFVEKFEPFIRRSLRFRLQKSSLRQAADSVDLCQSVICGFLIRLNAGDYEIRSEEDLRKLLVAIANKKFLMLKRRETAAKRDRRLTCSLESVSESACRVSDQDAKQVEYSEMIQEVRQRLGEFELALFDSRRSGLSWEDISSKYSENQLVLRKRLSRALQKIATDLQLEDLID